MSGRSRTVRRRACVAGLISFALLGSIFVVSYTSNAQSENGSKSFRAAIKIKKTRLYCSGMDNRVYLKTQAIYGQPKERLGLTDWTARVQVKVKVLKRKGKRRVIASAVKKGSFKLKVKGRKISQRHTVRFGPKRSKRILRHVYGTTS